MSTNKVRLLLSLIIAVIISIIVFIWADSKGSIWAFKWADFKLSEYIGLILMFTTLLWPLLFSAMQENISEMQENTNELFDCIVNAIVYIIVIIVCTIFAIGVFFLLMLFK